MWLILHRRRSRTYRTVKNFGGQKVLRKGLLQCIGGKNFGEKHVSFPCNQLEISAALPFRQVSNASQMKRISVFPGIILEISIDALIACCLWWDGYLKVNSLWKP